MRRTANNFNCVAQTNYRRQMIACGFRAIAELATIVLSPANHFTGLPGSAGKLG